MLAVGAAALALFLAGDGATADAADASAPASTAAAPALTSTGVPVQEPGQEPVVPGETIAADTGVADTAAVDTTSPDLDRSREEATTTIRALWRGGLNLLPKVLYALVLLLAAGLLAKLVRMGLRAALSSWERADATAALVAIGIWLVALGAALSVIAGDARVLAGSVGLFGLALSWALQTPIESFTGWLLNSFRGYYRVGDRISVGDVFGDVARIDFLTTTVFEAGGPDKRVRAAQSTGALITFPNNEVLRSNITNFTRDFPYVWDEMSVAVANESDIPLAMNVLERTTDEVVGDEMEGAAQQYARLLERAHLAWDVAMRPEVYVVARDSWTDLIVRYMVPVREMRKWSTRLVLAVNEAMSRDDVASRVFAAYPRSQIQRLPAPAWATNAPEDDGDERDPGSPGPGSAGAILLAAGLAGLLGGCVEPEPFEASVDWPCQDVSLWAALPAEIEETSGVAASRRHAGIFWTHNDSGGDSAVFALDSAGAVVGRVRVSGATNRDWEDIDLGPCDAGSGDDCLFIGDMGDNRERYGNIAVYRVPEPDPRGDTASAPAERMRLRYPEGPRDAEALFVTDAGLHIVAKGRSHAIELFRVPAFRRADDPVVLTRVQRLAPPPASVSSQVTAAAASPDGRTVVIRSYSALTFYEMDGDTLRQVGEPADLTGIGQLQGEGVDLMAGGGVVLTGEKSQRLPATIAGMTCDPRSPRPDTTGGGAGS